MCETHFSLRVTSFHYLRNFKHGSTSAPQWYSLVRNKCTVPIPAFFYPADCHLHIKRGTTLLRNLYKLSQICMRNRCLQIESRHCMVYESTVRASPTPHLHPSLSFLYSLTFLSSPLIFSTSLPWLSIWERMSQEMWRCSGMLTGTENSLLCQIRREWNYLLESFHVDTIGPNNLSSKPAYFWEGKSTIANLVSTKP